MKYLMLFEDFDPSKDPMLQKEIRAGNIDKNALFIWMPYDTQMNNPIQSSMPKEGDEITWEEVLNIISEAEKNGTSKEIENAGLFMSHKKHPGESGFTRIIIRSFSPLKLDVAIFDDKFNLKSEFLNIDPNEIDLENLSKGASILTRSGVFDDTEEMNLKTRLK